MKRCDTFDVLFLYIEIYFYLVTRFLMAFNNKF